jgi:hypothetical protein
MFCAPGIVFGGTEGVGSRIHNLRARTRFRRYRGFLVPFSCFALPDSFSAVPRALGPVFMFCAPGLFSAVSRASTPVIMFCALRLVFDGTEGVGSRFHVLLSRNRIRRFRGRGVLFSGFALPDSFSGVPWASGPVFMIYASRLVFGGTEAVGYRFHVLRSRTRFRRYRGRRVPYS